MQLAWDLADKLQPTTAAVVHHRLVDEAEGVLKRLEASAAGMAPRTKVLEVERAQHARLCRRYTFRHSKLEGLPQQAGRERTGAVLHLWIGLVKPAAPVKPDALHHRLHLHSSGVADLLTELSQPGLCNVM